MRNFKVTVTQSAVECFEEKDLSRVDYTAHVDGGEMLSYKVIISHKNGRVNFGIDRGAAYCHYHAKNINPDYAFAVSS